MRQAREVMSAAAPKATVREATSTVSAEAASIHVICATNPR